jgi:hypothetical protein
MAEVSSPGFLEDDTQRARERFPHPTHDSRPESAPIASEGCAKGLFGVRQPAGCEWSDIGLHRAVLIRLRQRVQ